MPLFDDDDFDDGTFSLDGDSGGQDGGDGPAPTDQADTDALRRVNERLIDLIEVLLQRFVGGRDEGRFTYSYGEGWREDESGDEVQQLRERDPPGQMEIIEELIERYS